jgi:hypothetical protein
LDCGPLWITGACCGGRVPHDASGLGLWCGLSYATGTSSVGAVHDDDVPDLDLNLDTMADVLSQLEDAFDPTQPSQPLQGGQA